jgi:excinuclease ABC subunit B
MMEEMGYCNGIENYSRHLDGRRPGEPPYVLLNYFPEGFLTIIDESHISIPQLNGMYHGDRSRKKTLVEYGFRLPSALDNRPLTFQEFEKHIEQVICVSATPADYELRQCKGKIVEQIIRPTGLMDPLIEVKSVAGQVDDLLEEIRRQVDTQERTLVATLTKRMAEDLTEYYADLGIRVRYLHSEINTLERITILRDLRLGKFDVLIGINLLREGLDLPEVSLVAVLDADKEGFLRSARSLIQICGRTSRNISGRVILYGDILTRSMQTTIRETKRRRKLQATFNAENNITPESIRKSIPKIMESIYEKDYVTIPIAAEPELPYISRKEVPKLIKKLHKEMVNAAKKLEFERAAEIRDRINRLEKTELKYS